MRFKNIPYRRTTLTLASLILVATLVYIVANLYTTEGAAKGGALAAPPPVRQQAGGSLKASPSDLKKSGVLEPLPKSTDALLSLKKKAFAREYADFLRQSKLNAEAKDSLLTLAVLRADLPQEREAGLMNGRFKSVQEADDFLKVRDRELQQGMNQLLGDELPNFEKATEKIPIQREFDILAAEMGRMGVPLQHEQKAELVDLTWEKYKAEQVDYFYSLTYSRASSMSDLTARASARSRAYESVRKDAGTILTPEQLALLAKFQNAQVEAMFVHGKRPKGSGP